MTFETLKIWARNLKRDVIALWLAAKDQRTPWFAKVGAGVVAAYALSPIDLIPDFIPILGYLDDLILVPLGIYLVVKMIPAPMMLDFREQASRILFKPTSDVAGYAIMTIWALAIFAVAGFVSYWLLHRST